MLLKSIISKTKEELKEGFQFRFKKRPTGLIIALPLNFVTNGWQRMTPFLF